MGVCNVAGVAQGGHAVVHAAHVVTPAGVASMIHAIHPWHIAHISHIFHDIYTAK